MAQEVEVWEGGGWRLEVGGWRVDGVGEAEFRKEGLPYVYYKYR